MESRLYISHFLSAWNSRGFEFGAVLFLAAIFPATLLPLSVYALVRAASAVVFAAAVGRYIDGGGGGRLEVVRRSIVGQRGAVVASCALFGAMWAVVEREKKKEEEGREGRDLSLSLLSLWLMLGATVVLGCVEKLAAMMNTVAVERDWVIVIAGGDEGVLRRMNSRMRRIDLFCKLASPVVVALLLDAVSTPAVAIWALCATNSAAVLVEYALIARVYSAFPTLAEDRHGAETSDETPRSVAENLRIYAAQPAFLPSISLSILYLTVLSFSGQMVTYLLAVGFTPTAVSLVRILSSACEMSATWLAPCAMRSIGPVRAGIWFLSVQMICLGAGVLVFWTERVPVRAAEGLVAATVLSRIGLWGFDLSAQVIIQEEVAPQLRGSFSTTEAALQNGFEIVAYASTVVFARPEDFRYPALMSVFAVYVAGALYARFVRDRRGHLFHTSKCMELRAESHASSYQPIGSPEG